jgi:hypothetical protein
MATAKVPSPSTQQREPELIALARDPRTGEEFDIFSCLDRRGEPRLVPMPSSAALRAERGVLEVLHNVPFPRLRARQAALVAAMDAQSTTRRRTSAWSAICGICLGGTNAVASMVLSPAKASRSISSSLSSVEIC